jgi:hypothetical protein
MTQHTDDLELKERLNLIETMIAEGRRSTENWGWVFVLWGVAYYVAIAWSAWGNRPSLAWGITMSVAMTLCFGFIAWRMARRAKASRLPLSSLTRAVMAIWIGVGVSFIVLLPSLGIGGHSNANLVVAIIGTLLGTANAASSIILKWKLQFACAVVWWGTAVISCLGSQSQSFVALLVANFFCQIAFGIYCMIREAQKRRLSGPTEEVSHA